MRVSVGTDGSIVSIPHNFDFHHGLLSSLHQHLMTEAPVVYQWEARKRTPSPVFWQRITALHR